MTTTTRKCQVLGCGRPAAETGVPVNEIGRLNRPATVLMGGHPSQPPFACCDECAPQYLVIGLTARPIN